MNAILSQYSTTGLYNAPVSKGLIGYVILGSCSLHVPVFDAVKKYIVCSVADLFEKNQVWRFLLSKVFFLDTNDVIFCALLVYYFRIFERRMGSRRFSSHLLATMLFTMVLELLVWYVLHQMHLVASTEFVANGPLCLVFPLFINYWLDIPRVSQTKILFVPITGKTLTYLLGVQMLHSSKAVCISAICGLMAGVLHRFNVFRIQGWLQVPYCLAWLSDRSLGRVLKSSVPSGTNVPMGATLDLQWQQHVEALEQQMLWDAAVQQRNS